VGKIVSLVSAQGGVSIILSDHGNAEQMFYPDGLPCPSHTTNPVRAVIIKEDLKGAQLKKGGLSNVAPTILHLLNLKKPVEMSGESLIP